MNKKWMLYCATVVCPLAVMLVLILVLCRDIVATEPWLVAQQPELKRALEQAPVL